MDVTVSSRRAEWMILVTLPPGSAMDRMTCGRATDVVYRPQAVRVPVWADGSRLQAGTPVVVGRLWYIGEVLGAEIAEDALGELGDRPWVKEAVDAALGRAASDTWKAGACAGDD